MTAPLICLIAPGHLASTPRLVKEADALVDAGFRVHVVAGRHFAPADALDATLFSNARWGFSVVDWRSGPGVLARKIVRLLARKAIAWTGRAGPRLAARAHFAETSRLLSAARRVPADLYHGHCLAALAPAVWAAQTRRVPAGFDIQDYHEDETESASSDRAERISRRVLQGNLLRRCAVLTTAAPLIGEKVGSEHGVHAVPILNVFPRAHAPAAPCAPGPISDRRPARFYWFSQTVGPGRGLEAVVVMVGRLRTPTELHLRGLAGTDYVSDLNSLAVRAGLQRPIQFLPPAPPAEMARLAADADLGLSVEQSTPLNHDLCLANKTFVYLLAGIPQLLSPTRGQRALAPDLGAAALLGDPARAGETAAMLDAFFADDNRIRQARATAWDLAQRRYCWDVEQTRFVSLVEAALRRP